MQKLLLLDNYDSFTYNLCHLVEKLWDGTIDVRRNDEIMIEDVAKYDKLILSPGPGLPKDAGIMPQLLMHYRDKKPILGVCLGMQAIGECYGAKLKNLNEVVHGQARKLKVTQPHKLFEECPREFYVGRYHSWVIDTNELPHELQVLAVDEENNTMAVCHQTDAVMGVQFHPESILSEYGEQLIKNWICS